MLPKIGTAFFGVTVKAGVVQRLLDELQLVCCAVRAVTATAVHLALTNWVRVGLQRLGSLLLVAVETHFRLRRCSQHRVIRRMAGVAICARDLVDVVVVAVPAKTRIGRVAVHAQGILGIDRRRRVLPENSTGSGAFLAAPNSACMVSRRAMTGFALKLAVAEWSIRIGRVRVSPLEDRKDRIFLVAGEATVCALAAVLGILTVSGADDQE